MADAQPYLEEAPCDWVVDTTQQLEQRLGKPFKGVIWRGSSKLEDRVVGKDGSKMAYNGTVVRGCLMRALDGGAWVSTVDGLFLPEDVDGSRVLWQTTDVVAPARRVQPRREDEAKDTDWIVDTAPALEAVLGRNPKGVVWRASMAFEDKTQAPDGSKMALNGMHVRGLELLSAEGASWVKSDNGLYLPKMVQGACVLWPKGEVGNGKREATMPGEGESSVPRDSSGVSSGQSQDKSTPASTYISRVEKEAIDEVQCAMSQGAGCPLQSAITRAEDAGVGEEFLAPARQVMNTLFEREVASKALESALHSARGQMPGVDAHSPPSDDSALAKGASWFRMTFGRGGLAGSMPLPACRADMALLRGAVARAEQADVSQHLLVEARQAIVVLEERLQAASALEVAVQHGDAAVLRLAVARAERAGVDRALFAKVCDVFDADVDADEVSHTSSRRDSQPCIIDCPDTPVAGTSDAIDAALHPSTVVVPFGVVDDGRPVFDGSVEVVDYDQPHPASCVPFTAHAVAQGSGPAVDRSTVAAASLPPRPPSAGAVGRQSTAWEDKEGVAPPQPQQLPSLGRGRLRAAWAEGSEESSGSEDSTERAITEGALRLLQTPPSTSCTCLPYARLTDGALAVLPAQTS